MADEHADVPAKLAERTVEEGGALTQPNTAVPVPGKAARAPSHGDRKSN